MISSDGLLVVLGLSEGYATQKRMTGANEGFLEDSAHKRMWWGRSCNERVG
jgi:hypothetical protein